MDRNLLQAETDNARGAALARQGKLSEAAAAFQCALALCPNHAQALNNLGNVLNSQGKFVEAVTHYRRALTLQPDNSRIHFNLGNGLAKLRRLEEAEASYRRALGLRPDYFDARNGLAMALVRQGKLDEAAAAYRQALTLRPDHAEAHNNLGNILKGLGKIPEAVASYERSLAIKPSPAVFHNLAAIKRFAADGPELAAMEELAGDAGSLPAAEQVALQFTLGKAYHNLGDADRAFPHFQQGNALKRRQFVYDEAATLGRMERIQQVFTLNLMAAMKGMGDPSECPIFILGMPRSGTSLVEQILASHPRVFGAGERSDFSELAGRVLGAKGYPAGVGDLSPPALQRLASAYLQRMRQVAPQTARITDKMPGNFIYAGLIHYAFPNARIIHTRRDPADTCLSCHFVLFNEPQPYTYDLAELGRYYRAYRRLMEHWREVIPESAMIDIDYETLVADLEGQTRRMLDHCGLAWDPACLAFHKTERTVLTASAGQVREPVHQKSVGRWRTYAKFLQPLLEELGPQKDSVLF